MPERKSAQSTNPRQHGANPIDTVACVAAVSWFGVAVVWSWWRAGVPLLISLGRALMGAICVYVVVFIGFYVIVRLARKNHYRKIRKAGRREAG